jgi:hypothetical protein
MFDVIKVPTDPREILDRVDDMLAWMRIASEAKTSFDQSAYRRAQPYIDMGNRQLGIMMPDSVVSFDGRPDREASFDEHVSKNVELIGTVIEELAKLGERPCMATMTESTGHEEAAIARQSGDNIDDLCAITNDTHQYSYYKDLRYTLKSASMLPASRSVPLAKHFKLPQAMRIVEVQTHLMFKDGRASAGHFLFGYEKATGLFDINKKRPVTVGHGVATMLVDDVMELFGSQWLRRDEWTVELSASPERTGVGLATDCAGALALVSELRDSRDHQRMVHWVSEHMRRRRSGGDPVRVRAHLRGKQAVRVGRYWATVYPSRTDIARACNGPRFDVHTAGAA